MLYHKTKDVHYVQQALGHKRIANVMIYITIEQARGMRKTSQLC